MSEVERYRERVAAAQEALEAVPVLEADVLGPPDEETGERWDRANVLGHLAEMLPFWTGQVREVLAGGTEMGRGEAGYARRREGIDSAGGIGEEELRHRVGEGIAGLRALLADLRDEDLERPLVYRAQSGERDVDLRFPVEQLLVGHLEAHVRQLQELSVGG
jgi:hypothetical protein